MSDTGQFWGCYSGSFRDDGFVAPNAECLLWFDFDEDGDVDMDDYFIDTAAPRHLFYDAFSDL